MIRGRGVIFFRTCIVCLLQRYWLFTKKLCYLLFSISVAIGQFCSNWPGLSSRTVKYWFLCFTLSNSFTGSCTEVKVFEIGGVGSVFFKKGKFVNFMYMTERKKRRVCSSFPYMQLSTTLIVRSL